MRTSFPYISGKINHIQPICVSFFIFIVSLPFRKFIGSIDLVKLTFLFLTPGLNSLQWRTQWGLGGGFQPPPRTGKNCCRKMMLFPKVPFLATTFPKIDKNSNFRLNFHQKFPKFSQNFQTICSFRPNARKINAGFVKFFEKYAKIMDFSKFPNNLSFVQTREKLTHGLQNFLKNAKIMHFLQFS